MIPYNHPLYPFPYNLEDRINKINSVVSNEPIKYTLTFLNNELEN